MTRSRDISEANGPDTEKSKSSFIRSRGKLCLRRDTAYWLEVCEGWVGKGEEDVGYNVLRLDFYVHQPTLDLKRFDFFEIQWQACKYGLREPISSILEV